MHKFFWISSLYPLLLAGCNTVIAAPLDVGGKGLVSFGCGNVGRSRVERSCGDEGFVLRQESGAVLHSEGPELEEAAAEVEAGSGAVRARRELKEFLREILSDKINCSIEFPIKGSNRGRRDVECTKEMDGKVVCSIGGFRFVLDGGLNKMNRVRRFVEEVYELLDKVAGKVEVKGKTEDEELDTDFTVEGRDKEVKEKEKEGMEEKEEVIKSSGEEGKESAGVNDKNKKDLVSLTAGLEDNVGGPIAGDGCGCSTPECPTFRVYPPFCVTPCCRTTQGCPTKPCPAKPNPVMLITAGPPCKPPCPTVCCLGEPTCVCQSTTCPTPCSSTCREQPCPCPLAGQFNSKLKNASQLKLTTLSQARTIGKDNVGGSAGVKEEVGNSPTKEEKKFNPDGEDKKELAMAPLDTENETADREDKEEEE